MSTSVLALAAAGGLAGCRQKRPAAPAGAAAPASFTPEGRWRSSKMPGMVMTVHVRPDGTLEMLDPHGVKHPFPRIGPDRWHARISRVAQGSIYRVGDQLVFRKEATPEAMKPIAQKNGLMIVHSFRPMEDRMTRVPETTSGH